MSSPTPEVAPGGDEQTKTPDDRRLKGSFILSDRTLNGAWARYITGIKLGMTKGDAADYAGIGVTTVRLWRTNAHDDELEEKDSIFREFFAEVNSARAGMLSRCLSTVEKARQDGDLKAATWMLERHGYHKTVEIDAKVSAELTYVVDTQDLEA